MIFVIFLFLILVVADTNETFDCSTPPYCNDNGNCVSENTLCTCMSGYYGDECELVHTCETPETALPVETEFTPTFLQSSKLDGETLKLRFESEIVTNRYDYRIKIGNVESGVCDSWLGSKWWQFAQDCSVFHNADLDWNSVENDCDWEKSTVDSTDVFVNKIRFEAKENFGDIHRKIAWEYELKIEIPKPEPEYEITIEKIPKTEDL